MVNNFPSEEDFESLWGVCVEWINHNKVRSRESLQQVDSVVESLLYLADEILSIVGLYEDGK